MEEIQRYCKEVEGSMDTSMPLDEKARVFETKMVRKLKALERESMGVIGYAFYALMRIAMKYPDLCQQPVVHGMLEQGNEQLSVLREVVPESGLPEEERAITLTEMALFETEYASYCSTSS
jgi:hypothetical protein